MRIIPVHVTPKSATNRIEGWEVDAAGARWLKVRLTSPPEDGKANKSLLKLLAKAWGIPASQLTLQAGAQSRYKRVAIPPDAQMPDYDDLPLRGGQ